MKRVTIDFETRSEIDLKKQGAWIYSRHWSTVALCLAWTYDDDPLEDVFLWHPALPAIGLEEAGRFELECLFEEITGGVEVEAHNAFFERVIWGNVMRPRLGWPEVRESQWRCTAAKAASFNLPRKLERVCEVLGTPHQKDMSGHREMLRLSKPRRATKRDPLSAWVYDEESFAKLFHYCKADVLAERDVSRALRDLPPDELEAWRIDQRINLRGVTIDRPLCERAIELATEVEKQATAKVIAATDGAVKSQRQVKILLEWIHAQGYTDILNLRADTVEKALGWESMKSPVREVLEARRASSKSSTKKYQAMLNRADEADDRMRDILLYQGAGPGRWVGQGPQIQNMPRGTIKKVPPDRLCDDLMVFGLDDLEIVYNDPMAALSQATRHAIIAAPGQDLYCADFASIEACGVFWISGQDDALEIMRAANEKRGPKLYNVMAGEIFNLDPVAIDKESYQYQVGKQAILGLGYQMGGPKFQGTCETVNVAVSLELAESTVAAYRQRFWKVPQFWKDTEAAAKLAIQRGDGAEPIWVGRTCWAMRGRFLHCRLPSGRLLSYYRPSIETRIVQRPPATITVNGVTVEQPSEPWIRQSIVFWGVDQKTKAWVKIDTYGGKLTENIVQGLCRDLLRDSMIRLERLHDAGSEPYVPVMTVHDEVVSEAAQGRGDLGRYESIVEQTEPWATGIPVKAEGWRGRRYRK